MASQVDICNQALTKVGAARIVSLADGTKQANALAAIYDAKRDAELAAHPWTFAIKRVQLPASVTAPVFGWGFAYPLPSDFLSLVEVGEEFVMYGADGDSEFQIEGGQILTDAASPLNIRYVWRVTNPGLYPAPFVEALACRLAAELAESLTQSLPKREAAWAERRQALRDARHTNAIEMPPRKLPAMSWELALIQE